MTAQYKAIVLGTSAGGIALLKQLVSALPADFLLPIAIVQHVGSGDNEYWINTLNELAALNVKEADEKEVLLPGTIYLAPPNYHLLIEDDYTFTFTVDERVNYARPAIDVLFETAAEAYRRSLIGIVLTGANFDGAHGLKYIKGKGGLTIVQDPKTAEASAMPTAAIQATDPHYILPPDQIMELLRNIHSNKNMLSHETH